MTLVTTTKDYKLKSKKHEEHNTILLKSLEQWYVTRDTQYLWREIYPVLRQVATSYIYANNRKQSLSQPREQIEDDATDIALLCLEDIQRLTQDASYRIETPSAWIWYRYLKVRYNPNRQFNEQAISLEDIIEGEE